jgi:hypothetical protein
MGWLRSRHARDFFARVFAGLLVAGVDDLVDFNCQSGREEGICFVPDCPIICCVFAVRC